MIKVKQLFQDYINSNGVKTEADKETKEKAGKFLSDNFACYTGKDWSFMLSSCSEQALRLRISMAKRVVDKLILAE